MNVLITGGVGFIGSHLADRLTRTGFEVTVIDDFSSGCPSNIRERGAKVVQASILDAGVLRRVMSGVDLVYHLAAYTSAPGSMDEPYVCAQINNLGTLNVLSAMRDAGCKKIIAASSAAVYGNDPTLPKVESLVCRPESIYALSKADMEAYMSLLASVWGFEAIALRFFNVFGPRQNPDSGYAAAVPNFCKKASHDQEIVIYGDGEQTRDFIFVEDLIDALLHAGKTQVSCFEVYNVGYEESISINDLVREILKISQSKSSIRHAEGRVGDVLHSLADATKLKNTGWSPRVGFRKGLEKTVRFYLERM